MADIRAYGRPNEPYRYRSLSNKTVEREIEAVTSGFIFCPYYHEMNDPMEGSHRESALLRESRAYEKILSAVKEKLGSLGIASFSETFDHEPMWAHYAGNFTGMCIAYSVRSILANLPDDCELVKMTYSEKPPILLKNSQSVEDRAKLILSNKALRWSSEREWRLISPIRGPARYGMVSTAKRVYIGSQTSEMHSTKIIKAMKACKIPVKKMSLSSYEVSFQPAEVRMRQRITQNT